MENKTSTMKYASPELSSEVKEWKIFLKYIEEVIFILK